MGIRFICFLLCLGLSLEISATPLCAQAASGEPAPKQELSKEAVTKAPQEPSKTSEQEPSDAKPTAPQSKQPAPKVATDSSTLPAEPSKTSDSVKPNGDAKPDESSETKSKGAKPKAVAKTHSTELLPVSTKAWFSVPDVNLLEEKFDETQFGKLAADPAIKPFVESIKQQAQEWLDDKNVRLGVKVGDIDQIHAGEICIAGVLQDLEGGQPARGSHGLVLLVDVTGNEKESQELFVRVNADLEKKKGAVQEQLEINGVNATKITIKNPKRIRHSQFSFQVIHNGWLLVADNEEIFRDIMRRIAAPEKIRKESTLSMQLPFTEVMKQTELFENSPNFSWFVDPFGYLQLAQKIEEEEQDIRKHKNDWPKILREQGFDAIRGMGGNIALAVTAKDEQFELLNRIYIFAPRTQLGENQQRIFDLFDFRSGNGAPPLPAAWVPADASGYFSANWDFTKLLNSFGHVYDAFMGNSGEFNRMIEDFKTEPDFQLDVRKLIGMLDDQFSIISTTERPITEDSERMVVGLRMRADSDPDFVFKSIKRAVGRKNGKMINLAGVEVIEVDTTIEPETDDLEEEFQLPPGFEDFDDDPAAAAPPEEPKFALFQKRYFVVHQGFLLVANDKLYLKKLLTSNQKIRLHETPDYVQTYKALDKLTDAAKVSFRQFARSDRALETNYEMLRRGEMAKSQTVLAKILNKIFEPKDEQPTANQVPREQKLDGSKLPEDYAKSVAPYLGPSGWVLETEADGWRVTGCALKKIIGEEAVKKAESTEVTEKAQR